MSTTHEESLHEIFRNLHAHREKTMDPAALQVNIDQRRRLVETTDPQRFVRVHERLQSFSLTEVDSGPLEATELVAQGPAVLIFFRFEGCPACNLALPYYERNLAPALRELGVRLVAVSPQIPERLVAIKRRHSLSYDVATDPNLTLARRLGIVYTFDEASRRQALANGRAIGDVTGTGTWELPMPTALVIDEKLVVRFADVHPDWLLRTEAGPILDAVRALRATPAHRIPHTSTSIEQAGR